MSNGFEEGNIKLHKIELAQFMESQEQLLELIAFLLGEGKGEIANVLAEKLLSAIHVITESQRFVLKAQKQVLDLKRCVCNPTRQKCGCNDANVWALIQAEEFADRLIDMKASLAFSQKGLELLEQRYEILQPLLQIAERWADGLCTEKELDLVWQNYLISIDESVH